MYHTLFIINEGIFLLFSISSSYKNSFDLKEKAPDTDTSQLGQTVDTIVSKTTA